MHWALRAILFGGVLLIADSCYQHVRGTGVLVVNAGPKTLSSMRVHVTGASYALGDLPPGAFATVYVQPTSESHVEVSFRDSAWSARRLVAGGYFEPGYGGSYAILLDAERILRVDDNTY